MAKGAALLRELRQVAGLTLDELGRVEKGKDGLPFESMGLTAVHGRNDPVGFALQMTRAYNPQMWSALAALGVGPLLVQAQRRPVRSEAPA